MFIGSPTRRIEDARFVPMPPGRDLDIVVQLLVDWWRSRKEPGLAVLDMAMFHYQFETMHPFTDGNGRTGRQILNLMLMAAGYRPVAIKHDAGRSYGKSLEAWQVDGDPKPFISQLVQCVDQEERAVAEIVGRLRENPFSENAIDGIGLEDGPARGRSL